MSQHPSLRISGKIRKVRNVMKRYERINVLRDSGRKWEECSPEELDDLWRRAKENEKRKDGTDL